MSTNSNDNDDLMEDTKQKQTKLQKFLKTIDDETFRKIQSYIQEYQKSIDPNNKSQKIKLYHDMIIIRAFKCNEKQIGSSKKKVEEICQTLRQQINFSIATIKQRIQKKLSNVSKQTLLDHIKLGMDLAFDTKRKLMPIKSISKIQSKYQLTNNDLDFEDNQHKSQYQVKKQEKPIQIKSSGSESPKSVQQIKFQKKQITKKFKKKPIPEQLSKQKQAKNFRNMNLFNQFRQISDHQSDNEVLIVKQNDVYRISTQKAQAANKELLEKVARAFSELKEKQNQRNSNDMDLIAQKGAENLQSYANGDFVQQPKSQHAQQQHEKRENKSNQKTKLKALAQQYLQPPSAIDVELSNNFEQQILPPKQQLYMYCSIKDWKLAKDNKNFENLKWEEVEDQFLRDIINSTSSQDSLGKLQILKRYKEPQNILQRIKFLKISPSESIIACLVGSQPF